MALERRGRFERKTEIKRGEGPKVDRDKLRAWQDRSRKALPRRSEKRQGDMTEERIPFVIELLRRRYRCEVGLVWCCTEVAVDVNELQRGAYRLDCWLDEEKVTTACRECHDWLTLHPDWARRHGHQVHSNAGPEDFERAALIRATALPGQLCKPMCLTDHRL